MEENKKLGFDFKSKKCKLCKKLLDEESRYNLCVNCKFDNEQYKYDCYSEKKLNYCKICNIELDEKTIHYYRKSDSDYNKFFNQEVNCKKCLYERMKPELYTYILYGSVLTYIGKNKDLLYI